MMVNWLVQTNLIKEDIFPNIEKAAKGIGFGCTGLKIIPFSDSIEFGFPPGFEIPRGKIIPYGSTSMIKMIDRSSLDKSGFFFNQENLKTSKWARELGNRVLNYDAQFMTLAEAMKLTEGEFFMKPDNDLKDFSGSEVTAHGIRKFYDQVSAGGFTFGTDIPVVLCPLKNTGWEYRLFMIENYAVGASSYKLKTMLRQDKRVPDEVFDFANSVAEQWRPDDVYVMDVCETDKGLKVVEFNCFNASGFYACDIENIVEQVSYHVERK